VLRLKYPPELKPQHLLDGNFVIVNAMSDLSEACGNALQASFVNYWNPAAPREQIAFADPGEAWESSDFLIGGLPFRRLIFGGLGAQRCFVYFEKGGGMGPATCLGVMDYAQGKALWVGRWVGFQSKKVANIKELRRKLSQDNLSPEGQRGC
jgi:hypothetical protein